VPVLIGFVSGVAVVLRIGLVVSDARHRRRVSRRQPHVEPPTVVYEVEKTLRHQE
jgi:hypothetical protein